MKLKALTHICYVRESHLDAQLDSLKENNKGKNNLPTNRRETITFILGSRAFNVKEKRFRCFLLINLETK
jgi:hypothetical protein